MADNTEEIIKRVVKDMKENDIILMRDICKTSVSGALESIDFLQTQGYEFVTVNQLLLE